MSERSENTFTPNRADDGLPEALPPVKPPSVGFIVQLFVVPGMIVGVLVLGYLLLQSLVRNQDDWQEKLSELKDVNPHIRWRAGVALADMLSADQKLGERGRQLARNAELAESVARLLDDEMARVGAGRQDLDYQKYFTRTLGLFDLPDRVVPTLMRATASTRDDELRQDALTAIAVMQNRLREQGTPIRASLAVPGLIEASQDETPLIRQISAFALGMFDDDGAKLRLDVMLDDRDLNTRLNAAVGLARNLDPRCVSVLIEGLRSADEKTPPGSPEEFTQFVRVKNCINAAAALATVCTAEQRRELLAALKPIAESHRDSVVIRPAAATAMKAIESAPSGPAEAK
jgi:HEAT repeat protein